ncbi:uncharacterized protein LOC126772407 [Nymphalis io]|uniref:uncharacterized protein LOC126772407 n=1 Tax=Inachis io TaxID=171585 RepID=UPI002169DE5C|nr:uncharacterized protein LOC126772407 [Nymphalis io]
MEESIAISAMPSPAMSAEGESTQIIEEGPRVCPLCSSEIRFFFINFNEKMLMCENLECEFPFGYEDLQFLRFENEEDMSDFGSVRTRRTRISSAATPSVISTTSWSDIDKINRVYDSEELEQRLPDIKPQKEKRKNKKNTKNTKDSEILIQKHVEDIKGLNMELMEISAETKKTIKNERWIKNLMTLQANSGVKLLKPEELKHMKKENKDIKINIDTGKSVSTIKIQMAETDV